MTEEQQRIRSYLCHRGATAEKGAFRQPGALSGPLGDGRRREFLRLALQRIPGRRKSAQGVPNGSGLNIARSSVQIA
jgi:hypothetical protein